MNMLISTGKIMFALGFAAFGILHLMNAEMMAGIVPPFIPGGVIWVYITGLAFLAAAIAIVTGKQMKLAGILLALELAIFVLTIHLPLILSGDMMAMGSLLKDSMLAGAALIIAGLAGEKKA